MIKLDNEFEIRNKALPRIDCVVPDHSIDWVEKILDENWRRTEWLRWFFLVSDEMRKYND